MKIDRLLEKLPPQVKKLINLAQRAAEHDTGNRIYLVGGFVRDLLLGVDNFDLDFVVEGDAVKTAERLCAALGGRMVTHRRFGTVNISLPELKIDVATARTEVYPAPASLPVVEFSSLKEDLRRRDFSINAMAVSINARDFGELEDFFFGRQDLLDGKVRVLHEASFIDDPTRILRAVRFEQRYGFRIERSTLKLLREAALAGMLSAVQPHRLRDELVLMLKEGYPYRQLIRLQRVAGLGFLHPRLALVKKQEGLFRALRSETAWFKDVFGHRRGPDNWVIYLAALLDGLNVKETTEFCAKFGFRNGEVKRVLSVKQIQRGELDKLRSVKSRPAEIYAILEPLSYEAILYLKAKYGHKVLRKHIEDFLCFYNGLLIHINGRDLQELGCSPGPGYQRIFSEVLEARLNGEIHTKQDELAMAQSMIDIQSKKKGAV